MLKARRHFTLIISYGDPRVQEVKAETKEADCVDARDDDILKEEIRVLDGRFVGK